MIAFSLFGIMVFAQTYPELSGMTYKDLSDLQDWYILTQAEGRLDKDAVEDRVIILESKDSIVEKRCENCPGLPNKARIIAVLLSNDSQPKVGIQNNRFIARPNEGGTVRRLAPKIKIADNALLVYYQYERSSNIEYRFEFREKELVLVHGKSEIDHDGELVVKNYDFVNGNLTIESTTFPNPENNRMSGEFFTSETEVIDVSHHQLRSLADFKEMYSWEIVEYHKL